MKFRLEEKVTITLTAGGMATVAADVKSAIRWINQQSAQGEDVSFVVECDNPTVKTEVEKELTSALANWKK